MKIFDKKLFIALFFVFIAATIIGTLSHEFGHYLVAKYFGYDAEISYAYTSWANNNIDKNENTKTIFFIILGGPIQTILTGTVGLVFLLIYRKSFNMANNLSVRQWTMIFFALFWLRQPANLILWLRTYFISGKFSFQGDEIKIANYLHLPVWTIITVTAIIGAGVLTVVILKYVPLSQRLTFIAAGLVGGITGFVLWLVLFGKYILP